MSASTLHWKAKALVNAGLRLQRLKASEADPYILRRNQREVARQAARFVSELVGDAGQFEILPHENPTDYCAAYLSAWRPIFPEGEGANAIFWSELIDEVARLSYGDNPSILEPAARARGQSETPAKLSFLRLRALEWAAYFKANGCRPKNYQPAISLAFGADWDAIRHWRSSAKSVIGELIVRDALDYAVDGYFIVARDRSRLESLYVDGASYRIHAGIADLDPKVFHIEWEKIAHSLSVPAIALEV